MATVEVEADLAEEVSEVEALEAEEPEAVFKNKNIHNFNSICFLIMRLTTQFVAVYFAKVQSFLKIQQE